MATRSTARARVVVLLLCLLAAAGCGRRDSEGGPAGKRSLLAGRSRGVSGFIDRLGESGIDFVNHTGRTKDKRYIVEAKGAGVLALDYDGDGRLDIYCVDGNTYRLDDGGNVLSRSENPAAKNRLYRNLGGWRFEDVTEKAGVGDRGFGFGGAVGDYDNDGHPDIYVCNWGRNVLYHSNGDGTFSDVTEEAGVGGGDDLYSTCASFFDADGDGDLDLYLSNYCDVDAFMRRTRGDGLVPNAFQYPVIAGPCGLTPLADSFFRNNGDGTFSDESDSALADQEPRYSFTSVVTDFDRDGDLDVYVATDMCRNTLWVNDGKGRFTDRGRETGTDVNAWGYVQAGMGNDSADFDQDGWPDLLTTNYLRDQDTLYRNLTGEIGTPYFEDTSGSAGLTRGDFMKVCWCTGLWDFDLDGYLDIFVAAGHFYDTDSYVVKEGAGYRQLPTLWMNDGPPKWTFRLADTEESGPGLRVSKVGRGGCFGDFDNDGDTDVYVAALNDRPLLLENRLPRRGRWLALRLEGLRCNRDAIGAKVTVHAGDGRVRQMLELRRSAGFLGANDPRLRWGLGAVASADRIEVVWPNGSTQEFRDVPVDAEYRLVEGGTLERVAAPDGGAE